MSPQISEADLMLALNKSLQKAEILSYIWFSRMGYLQSGPISALNIEKSNTEQLTSSSPKIYIGASKVVDEVVTEVEVLEH